MTSILFAQVNRFSYTNELIEENLPAHLGSCNLIRYRVYPAIRKNPLWLVICLIGVAVFHGPGALLDGKGLPEKLVKTPVFFRLASYLVRRRARSMTDLSAVLQTQGLFNGKVQGVPLFIYTDNTILNRINTTKGLAETLIPEERALYTQADGIAVSASHGVTSLVQDYGIAPERVHNVLIGANSRGEPITVEGRYASQNILFVGIDWERKGGPDLVAAFARIASRFPQASLTIAGCRPALPNVPRVTALGKVSQDDVARLMAKAAIYCMPSHSEPSSVAVIEAASAGLPIVGTAAGGFLDSVISGETGLLVPIGDVEALADALATMLSDPTLCENYGAAGKRHVQQFQWPVVCAKIAGVMTGT